MKYSHHFVLYSYSWTSSGVTGYILDAEGNIKYTLPDFYELFPADWEIPSSPSADVSVMSTSIGEGLQTNDFSQVYNGSVYLKKPSTTVNTTPFFTMQTTGFAGTASEYNVKKVQTTGIYGSIASTAYYNLGYSNATTGASLAWAVNLENGESFSIAPPSNITLGIRASTDNHVGNWTMQVYAIR